MQKKPTGIERSFGDDEIIVSKTDLTGRITYANEIFLRVSGYSEKEALGAPHSMIRHPDMPRSVFQVLWDRLRAGKEIFAYVVNLAKNGDHYWVFAHVTPSFDASGKIIGFHSNRRVAQDKPRRTMEGLYAVLRGEEARQPDKASAVRAGVARLEAELAKAGVSYDEFIFAGLT